jgi:hypothetical protein
VDELVLDLIENRELARGDVSERRRGGEFSSVIQCISKTVFATGDLPVQRGDEVPRALSDEPIQGPF